MLNNSKKSIGFISTKEQNDSIDNEFDGTIVPVNFTNSIAFGQTGSGKTSNFIFPNIENRMKLGHTIIVYVYKQNLANQVKALAKRYGKLNDVIEIGVPWGYKIDILDGANEKDLDCWDEIINNEKKDDWSARALNFVKMIKSSLELAIFYNAIRKSDDFKGAEIPSLNIQVNSTNFKAIADFSTESKIIKLCETLECIDNAFGNPVFNGNLAILQKREDCKILIECLKDYTKMPKDSGAGNRGVWEIARNFILEFAKNPSINGDKFLDEEMLNSGKIILINNENLGERLSDFFHVRLFNLLQSRLNGTNNSTLNGVSIFIDEAHKIITERTMPEASVCRESKYEYFIATQNIALLTNKVGEINMASMLQNLCFQITFKNADNDLEKFEYTMLETSTYGANHRDFSKTQIFFDEEEIISAQKDFMNQNEMLKEYKIYEKGSHKKIEIPKDSYLLPTRDSGVAILNTGEKQILVELYKIEPKLQTKAMEERQSSRIHI